MRAFRLCTLGTVAAIGLVLLVTRPWEGTYGGPVEEPPTVDIRTEAVSSRTFAELCKDDPIEAIAESLRRYRADVREYSCVLEKRERIKGKLRDTEIIRCDFREAPFAVEMRWVKGGGRASAILYPASDRDKVRIVPSNSLAKRLVSSVERPLTDRDVQDGARYTPNAFGMYHGTARVYTAWKAARERNALHTEYQGVRAVPELGGRTCYVLHRRCAEPEEEGLTEVTVLFDTETLLQTGSVLKAGEDLLATYYFRDVRVNPAFLADRFAVENFK